MATLMHSTAPHLTRPRWVARGAHGKIMVMVMGSGVMRLVLHFLIRSILLENVFPLSCISSGTVVPSWFAPTWKESTTALTAHFLFYFHSVTPCLERVPNKVASQAICCIYTHFGCPFSAGSRHQQDIFLLPIFTGYLLSFFFFGTILCKPSRCLASVWKSQSLSNTQTSSPSGTRDHAKFKVTLILSLPRSDARFELQKVVFDHVHAPKTHWVVAFGWLAICDSKKLTSKCICSPLQCPGSRKKFYWHLCPFL